MPSSNTINGKAFEYACLQAFLEKLHDGGAPVSVVSSAACQKAADSFSSLPEGKQERYMAAARTAVKMVFPLEPQLEQGEGTLLLAINPDSAAIGVNGDVRDVLCLRNGDRQWQIGLSCKHNHEALRHPRITESKDFGSAWIGYPCSRSFIDDMTRILAPLTAMEEAGVLWNTVANKHTAYYLPILTAFSAELQRLCSAHSDAPAKFLSYFFGAQDFLQGHCSGATAADKDRGVQSPQHAKSARRWRPCADPYPKNRIALPAV